MSTYVVADGGPIHLYHNHHHHHPEQLLEDGAGYELDHHPHLHHHQGDDLGIVGVHPSSYQYHHPKQQQHQPANAKGFSVVLDPTSVQIPLPLVVPPSQHNNNTTTTTTTTMIMATSVLPPIHNLPHHSHSHHPHPHSHSQHHHHPHANGNRDKNNTNTIVIPEASSSSSAPALASSSSASAPSPPHQQSAPAPPPIPQPQPVQQHPPAAPPKVLLPPQQRPAPVVDIKDRVTVRAIPSQTIVDGKLVIGHDTSTSIRSYTPLKNVGDGSFGTVVLADWHSPLPPGVAISSMQLNIKSAVVASSSSSSPSSPAPAQQQQRLVAIKRMKKPWQKGWSECSQLKELESLRRITPHPNIIPLYDAFLMPETKELHFVFECMEGNLYQLIKSRKGRPLAGGLVASIYRQVVLGLIHTHESGYFHRDMKPENLLVTTTGLADYSPTSPLVHGDPASAPPEKDVMVIIKLADFGLAREVGSKPPYTEYVSTRWYRAPEVLLRSTDYSVPVDTWALGTILAELVNLKPLFPGQGEVDQVARITEVLGDPTRSDGEYGFDERARVRGGGGWLRGIRMARAVGFTFPKVTPMAFHTLFEPSVPTSLIDCIVDLIRYDPEKRLTAQQCKDHAYWKETEHSMRSPITVQPTVQQHDNPHHPPQLPPQHHHHDANAGEQQQQQQKHRPTHITIPRPPDTNASSTSSNKSLRAAVAGMGIHQSHQHSSGHHHHHHQQHHQQQQQQHGHYAGQQQPPSQQQQQHHYRQPSGSQQYLGSGYPLPQMSPRTLPPSHSHPLSSGQNKPSFNLQAGAGAGDELQTLPPIQPTPSHSNHALSNLNVNVSTSHPHSLSQPNLHVARGQHGGPGGTDHQAFSPITPSASPGLLLLSPASTNADGPDMSVGAWQYAQAAQAHYHHNQSPSQRGPWRAGSSVPSSRAGGGAGDGLIEKLRELDLPPVPKIPAWAAGARASGGGSAVATLGSGTDDTVTARVGEMSGVEAPYEEDRAARFENGESSYVDGGHGREEETGVPMDISNRNSLDLSIPPPPPQAIIVDQMHESPPMIQQSEPPKPAPVVQPPAPQPQPPQPQASHGKFGLGSFGFGKKHKTWGIGIFGHGQSGSESGPAASGHKDAELGVGGGMVGSSSMPAAVGGQVSNSLKRGPSGSTGSLVEFQQQQVHQPSQPPPPPPPQQHVAPPAPIDPKAAKKLAEKARKDEARIKHENQQRLARERARAVMQKRKDVETGGILGKKGGDVEWERSFIPNGEVVHKDKGKEPDRSGMAGAGSGLVSGGVGSHGALAGSLGLTIPPRKNTMDPSPSAKHLLGMSSPETESPQGVQTEGRRTHHHRIRDPSGLPSLHSHHPHGHNFSSTSVGGGGPGAAGSSSQHYAVHPYELHTHLSRHKARRRDMDDDHSMSSADVQSMSRMSMVSLSTVDSDPGPRGHHRMGMVPPFRSVTTMSPYAGGSSAGGGGAGPSGVINRATSVSNLRSSSTYDYDQQHGHAGSSSSFVSPDHPHPQMGSSLPGGSNMHMHMGMTTVSPPMQMLTLSGSQRGATQSPPPVPGSQDGSVSTSVPQKLPRKSLSRGRLHPPSSFMSTLPSLPPISSLHSPAFSNASELSADNNSPPYELAPGSMYHHHHQSPESGSSSNPNGQTLPPFSHIASIADQSMSQQHQAQHQQQYHI